MRADVYHAVSSSTPPGSLTDFSRQDGQKRNVFLVPEGVSNNATTERAMDWRNNGSIGMSSLTMWLHLLDVKHPESGKVHGTAAPYDWDDFRKCHLLLEAVPEWKSQLVVMKTVSPIWSNLVDSWSELTSLYEQEKYKEVSDMIQKCRQV